MNRVVVQYKVKPDQVEQNEKLVRAVYAELADRQPDSLRYATVRLDDGVTFVHIAEHDGAGPNPLTELPAFAEFQREIAERCDEQPVARQASLVGSFRMLGGQ
jgi:hypothetical protein